MKYLTRRRTRTKKITTSPWVNSLFRFTNTGRRETYIKELEKLHINVTDLILGICFRVENPADDHYYGSIGRIGRALAETKNFVNYNFHIEDETLKQENSTGLKKAAETLPDYLYKQPENQ